MKTLIVTGGILHKEFAASFLEKNRYDYVIAVDAGVGYCKELGIVPHMIVGDFDTYGTDRLREYEDNDVIIRRFASEKDDTDTEIAMLEAAKRGGETDVLCAFGGRMDHMLANIHNLYLAMERGIRARLVDEDNIIFLADEPFSVTKRDFPYKFVSFVPFAGEVTGIKLKGFKYPLNGYTLKPGYSRCISNEMTGDKAEVEFNNGILIVINSDDKITSDRNNSV